MLDVGLSNCYLSVFALLSNARLIRYALRWRDRQGEHESIYALFLSKNFAMIGKAKVEQEKRS